MKTLKKTLCLVLAVVMAVGVLVLPASADYTDKDKIDSDYVAAVNALTQYGILKGKSTTEEVFDPTGNVTRAEVTAMVYRIMTGDTADTYVGNSASYATKAFPKDVFTAWQLGPVGFAANGEIVKGKGNGLFDPNGNVTGYELLVIMLRTLGYGQNHEYEGAKWQVNAITDARALGILSGVKGDMADSLSRQQVAQIVFNAATKCPRVTYVRGNYQYYRDPYDTESTQNVYLVKKATKSETATTTNPWGIPATTTTSTGVTFTYPATDVTKYYSTSTTPAQFDTYGPIRECDLATGLKVDGTHWAITYTNGKANKDTIKFEALDTVHKLGHEGTRIVAYKNPDYKTTAVESKDNPQFIVVFIDTFLGIVTKSWGNTTDPAGHVIKAAGAEVKVYFNTAQYASGNAPAGIDPNSDGSPITLTVDGTFTVGQKIGVNVVTVNQKASTNPVLAAYANAMKKDVPNTSYAATLDGKYPNGPQIDNSAKAAYELTKVSGVVLESITTNTNAGYPTDTVGFVAGGKQYYYNCTYKRTVLTAADLGKTYDLWLDSQGNVLDMALTQPVSGVGVVTNAVVRQVNATAFYIEATLLLPDGKEVTIDVGKNAIGDAYDNAVTASNDAKALVEKDGHLVSYTGTLNHYYVVKTTITDSGATMFESARADALRNAYYGFSNQYFVVGNSINSATKQFLVNDNTVFFVAEYTPKNVTTTTINDYNFKGYKIYNGFKALPELAVELSGQTLDVEAYGVDANGFAKYILIKNAYAQTEPARTISNINYAYLITKDVFGQVSPEYYTYTAIIEGELTTLKVALNQAKRINETGLYSYNQNVNGQGYSQVYLLDGSDNRTTPNLNHPYHDDFKLEAGSYVYAAGVLADNVNNEYYTVDDACKVILVNTTNGVYNATADLSYLDVYGATSAIWYQLNEKGYIDLIYIEESEVKPDSGLVKPDKEPARNWTVYLQTDDVTDNVGLPAIADCVKTATTSKSVIYFDNISLKEKDYQRIGFAVYPVGAASVRIVRSNEDRVKGVINYRIEVTVDPTVADGTKIYVTAKPLSTDPNAPSTITEDVYIEYLEKEEGLNVGSTGKLHVTNGSLSDKLTISKGGEVYLDSSSAGKIENRGTLKVIGNFTGSLDTWGDVTVTGNVGGNGKLNIVSGKTTVGSYTSQATNSTLSGGTLEVSGDFGDGTNVSKITVTPAADAVKSAAVEIGEDLNKAASIEVTAQISGEKTAVTVKGVVYGTIDAVTAGGTGVYGKNADNTITVGSIAAGAHVTGRKSSITVKGTSAGVLILYSADATVVGDLLATSYTSFDGDSTTSLTINDVKAGAQLAATGTGKLTVNGVIEKNVKFTGTAVPTTTNTGKTKYADEDIEVTGAIADASKAVGVVVKVVTSVTAPTTSDTLSESVSANDFILTFAYEGMTHGEHYKVDIVADDGTVADSDMTHTLSATSGTNTYVIKSTKVTSGTHYNVTVTVDGETVCVAGFTA